MNNQPWNYQFSRMSGVQSPVIPLVGELIKNSLRVAYGVLKPETAAPTIERLVTGLQVILG
ncbi:hypothetical protein CRD_02781 [Raphidiopsis brookii D9]|nr:hypothetical protein CRD_02781 [Raphidiopsis brookii D9]